MNDRPSWYGPHATNIRTDSHAAQWQLNAEERLKFDEFKAAIISSFSSVEATFIHQQRFLEIVWQNGYMQGQIAAYRDVERVRAELHS